MIMPYRNTCKSTVITGVEGAHIGMYICRMLNRVEFASLSIYVRE